MFKNMKKWKKILLYVLIGFILLFIFNFIVNETPIFYSEDSAYVKPDLSKLMIPEAAPIYHLEGNDTAIMFLHGFTTNCSLFTYYAEKMKQKGYDVIVELLPGMGTVKEDYYKTNFSKWFKSAEDTYLKYRKNYRNFFVAGLSMGGALTLKLAEKYSSEGENQLTGIIAISAPVFLNALLKHGAVSHPAFYFARTLSWFIKFVPNPPDKYKKDGNYRKVAYEVVVPKLMYSFRMGLIPIRKNLKEITIPVMLAQAKGDKVVPYQNLFYIANHISSKNIKIKVYDLDQFDHDRHDLVIYDSTRDDLLTEIEYFMQQYSN